MAFEVRGIEWEIITSQDGTRKARAACPDHPTQEATVLEAVADHVLVWCRQCGSVLQMCSKGELEAEKQKILGLLQKPADK